MCFSGDAEFSSHHSEAEQISSSLCYFMSQRRRAQQPTRPTQALANMDREFRVHYVKVVEASPRHSVDCLLFTPGKSENDSWEWSLKQSSLMSCVSLASTDHADTHTFNGPLSGTTRVSRYQKGKTNLDFTEARVSEWQWHQLAHMQVCTSLQTE